MYENEFEFNNEFYSSNFDEMYTYEMCESFFFFKQKTAYEIDDEYARDTYDVQELAYRHYA